MRAVRAKVAIVRTQVLVVDAEWPIPDSITAEVARANVESNLRNVDGLLIGLAAPYDWPAPVTSLGSIVWIDAP